MFNDLQGNSLESGTFIKCQEGSLFISRLVIFLVSPRFCFLV
jgi:hypothetical protein